MKLKFIPFFTLVISFLLSGGAQASPTLVYTCSTRNPFSPELSEFTVSFDSLSRIVHFQIADVDLRTLGKPKSVFDDVNLGPSKIYHVAGAVFVKIPDSLRDGEDDGVAQIEVDDETLTIVDYKCVKQDQ